MMLNLLFKLLLVILSLALSISVYGQSTFIDSMRIHSTTIDDCGDKELDDSGWPTVKLTTIMQNQRVCLRTKVIFDKAQSRNIAVSLSLLGASRIYWDGQFVGENGTVGIDKMTEVPGEIDYLLPLPSELLTQGEHLLTLEISSFHVDEIVPTIFYGLRVMDSKLVYEYQMQSTRAAMFAISTLLVFSLFFQLLFWLYQRQSIYQVFSALCLSSGSLLLAEKWRVMFGYTYDLQLTRLHWVMVFTYFSCLLLPLFYLIYYQVKNKFIWFFPIALLLFTELLIGIDYDYKGKILFFSSLIITLMINLKALKDKKSSSPLNTLILLSGVILFISSPVDFTEDRFTITLFAIVLVMLVSLIQEMKNNRLRSLASIRLEAELLKRNLQPHFLMNSLMLVIEWIEEKPQEAANFVQALSEELRLLVTFSDLREVALEEELKLCRLHLEIMAYRYKANYILDIQGSIDAIMIPPALIHTQIENAFSHNHVPIDAVFMLSISQNGTDIELTLTSPLNKKLKLKNMGVGERYIRARLVENYGQSFSYKSYPDESNWINTIKLKRSK
jgi:hypothetical protein